MKKVVWIIFITTTFLMIGCSNEDASLVSQENETEPEKKENLIPEAATGIEGILKEGPGKMFSTEEIEEKNIAQELEDLPESVSADEAYNYLTYLFAADYESILKQYEEFDPTFTVDGTPTSGTSEEAEQEEEKKQHIALLMDASGSMGAYVNDEQKMTAAKEALIQFVSDLPEDAEIMLRVYGHEGTSSDEDKELSCSSSEVVYPLNTYDSESFDEALSKFEPAGWTPLAASIEAAEEDLMEHSGDSIENIVYIISDGKETCDGDPVKAAKDLHDSGIATAVNIIGFDVSDEEQQQLKEVANAGGGEFTNVESGEDLLEAAQNNISEALREAENNIWSAMEKTDLNWDSVHKNDELNTIASDFRDRVKHENSLFMDGLKELQETEKITEEEADRLKERIEDRKTSLTEFNDEKKRELKEQVAEEKEKAENMIDGRREKAE